MFLKTSVGTSGESVAALRATVALELNPLSCSYVWTTSRMTRKGHIFSTLIPNCDLWVNMTNITKLTCLLLLRC